LEFWRGALKADGPPLLRIPAFLSDSLSARALLLFSPRPKGQFDREERKMKQAKRVVLIAAAAIAALTVPATSFAKGPSLAAQGFNGTVSAIPHMDGTQPMPPYPG
jgi:hypothetical protein